MKISKEEFEKLADKYLVALQSTRYNKEGNKPIKIYGIEELYKAIDVIQCCTQLKDKQELTFEEWIEKCGMQKVGNRIILKNNTQVSLGFMLEIYSEQINSGLL